MLAAVRLIGVRMADDASRSGAIFIVADDDVERPFVVGQDVVPGVRLSAVAADHVIVDVAGQAYRLGMDGAQTRVTPSAAPTRLAPSSDVIYETPSAQAWLSRTIAHPEESVGPSPGWRVRPPLSEAATAAGLQVGDLIVAINGVPPTAADAALVAARQDVVQLTVQRSSGERFSVWYNPE